MSFAQFNFNSKIAKALSICGYQNPTPIQVRSIPDILAGHDLVASAQTGTGKTAAFILPALERLSGNKSGKPRVLVLSPTRELALQIVDSAQKYGKFLNLNTVTLVGGTPYRQQLQKLSRPCDIIVATPGRLLDHMENKKIDLSAVEMLILDEADRMLDMGFIDDVKAIAKATPYQRQTLLFSATVDENISKMIQQLLKNPVRIDLSAEKLAPVSIKQEVYLTDNAQHKSRLLQHFLSETSIFKGIIFSATKINADKMAKELRDQGLAVAPLHGDLKQAVRNRTIEQFRRGKIQYLVATDVAARGIDVSDVTHVINFDLPKFSEDYVHRIGRTGRAGKSGVAISFVLPMEQRHLQKIERYISQRLALSTIPGLEAKKSLSGASEKPRKSKSKHKSKGFKSSSFEHGKKPKFGGFERAKKSKSDSFEYGRKPKSGEFEQSKKSKSDSFEQGKKFKSDSFDYAKRPKVGAFDQSKKFKSDSFDHAKRPKEGAFDRSKKFKSDSSDYAKRPKVGAFDQSKKFKSDGYDKDKKAKSAGFDRAKKSKADSFEYAKKPKSGGFDHYKKSKSDSFDRSKPKSAGFGAAKKTKSDSSDGTGFKKRGKPFKHKTGRFQ